MCFGSLPNGAGVEISTLKVGDQIIVLAGDGSPEFERDRVDIVWKVDGFSALTAGGIALSCQNVSKIVLTGNHFDDFLASPEAKAIWKSVQERPSLDSFESEPE